MVDTISFVCTLLILVFGVPEGIRAMEMIQDVPRKAAEHRQKEDIDV